MSIYITGDKHGSFKDYRALKKFCQANNTSVKDYMIILGDAGINYFVDERDTSIKNLIANIPITLICIHGNHEARPEALKQYKACNFAGGTAFYEDAYPNILFIPDGETITLENKTFLCLGGAYSVDKYYRLMTGNKWFSNEQTDEKTRNEILKKTKGKTYDFVLSHTCPLEWEPVELFLPGLDQNTVDASQEMWLTEVKKNITYSVWFFGHFHGEKISPPWIDGKYRMFYNDIIKIEDAI